jgi:hypothetical protein
VGARAIGNWRQQARPLLDTIRQQIEAAREALLPNLSRTTPAERYQVKAP